METRSLGKTCIPVTVLGIGTLTMSPIQRGLSVEEGAGVILTALERGVRFIDTAQMYGSYPQVMAALKLWRGDPVVVATKSAAASAEAMNAAIDEARRAFQRDVLDVFLMHAVKDEATFAARRPALDALLQAREKGIIRAIGATSHSIQTIRFLAGCPGMEVLHPMVNRDGWGILDATLEETLQVLGAAHAAGVGIYAMKPLGGGHLCGDAARALAWALARPEIDSAVVGMTSVEEVEMNTTIALGKPVSEKVAAAARGQTRNLFINRSLCLGCRACLVACDQGALEMHDGKAVVDAQKCVLCGYCAPKCPAFAIRII